MDFVPRAGWDARKPTSVTKLPKGSIDTVFFHYTGSESDEQSDHRNCPGRVKRIQTFHMSPSSSDPTKPWNDIAYSFVVCKHGTVYEGRGYGVMTAATYGQNGHSLAVCFLGNDNVRRDDLTSHGRAAFVDITAAIEKWAGKRLAYKGHKDAVSTLCPGTEIYAFVHSTDFAREVRQVRQPPDWYANALTLAPMWAWFMWRDHGQPAEWRPPQIPTKVPVTWWARYVIHKGVRT